ncbi:hypothetical protein PVAP13_3KG447100 [Panicum virgatum]|uniref:Uncharacterized protein n=1 Tax=Panicum virgatum TaxID=38727 RepID=A0A8T0VA22_PANVG|nr:hypothetical protein PVAP13_3KG447100 [Panicum virgatum]
MMAGRGAMATVVTRRWRSLSSAVWGWASQVRRRTARIAGMAALQGAMEPLSIFLPGAASTTSFWCNLLATYSAPQAGGIKVLNMNAEWKVF